MLGQHSVMFVVLGHGKAYFPHCSVGHQLPYLEPWSQEGPREQSPEAVAAGSYTARTEPFAELIPRPDTAEARYRCNST
jgi:hypothetical protein